MIQKIKKVLWYIPSLILGNWHNLWTLPLAIWLFVKQVQVTDQLGMFTHSPESVAKLIPALVVYLFVVSIVQIYFILQYPKVYFYSVPNHKKNKGWDEMSHKEKSQHLSQRVACHLILFGLILFGM